MALSACQYPMAASVSAGASVSDVPARSSTGCASGFHSRSPAKARSAAAESRSAWLSCGLLPGAPGSGQASSSAAAAAAATCSTLPGAR